jgi:predicted DNA binding protein
MKAQTVVVPQVKPRNHLVVAARFRQAGRHVASTGAQRQAAKQAVRRGYYD